MITAGKSLKVGIREAKAKFSELLGKVRQGAVVHVTDRGKEVAQIIPLIAKKASPQEQLKCLEEKGWISLPRQRVRFRKPSPVPKEHGLDLQKTLQEDRNAV